MVDWEQRFALGLLLAALGRAGKRPVELVSEATIEMGRSVGRPAMQVCALTLLYTAAAELQ